MCNSFILYNRFTGNMTDSRYWFKEVTTKFIEIYESHPYLWKIKSGDYTNRNLKNAVYDKLVEVCKIINPEANRDYAVTKIQSFRGSFRKEMGKMEESKRSGAADEIYTPTLWYFHLLLFTSDQEVPTPSIFNIGEERTENSTKEKTSHDDGSECNKSQVIIFPMYLLETKMMYKLRFSFG